MNAKQLLQKMVVSSRPISWINTAFPFAAGYLATGGSPGSYFWVATLYFLVPYNFLVYIVNDVYDYESDIQNPRKNSIEGGILPPSTHAFMLRVTILFNAVFLVYLLLFGTLISNLLLIFIVFAAVSYSAPPLRLKEKPFFDSINSSLHFVTPLMLALLLTGWQQAYWPAVVAFFFWGCASHVFGAVQDIIPDREGKLASIATYLGARNTVRFSLILYVLSIICTAILGWPAIIVCAPLVLYVLMVLPYVNLSDADSFKANKGWRKFLLYNQLTGFTVTMVLLLYYFGYV